MGSNRNLILIGAALVVVLILVFSMFGGGDEIEMPATGDAIEQQQ